MTSIVGETLLPALANAFLKVAETPPKIHKVYYTCELLEKNSWSCVRGIDLGVEKVRVEVCKFQPALLQKRAVAKKLDSKDVTFQDS